MKSLTFRLCNVDSAKQLRQLSLITFVDAFGALNGKDDMDAYCSIAFSLDKIKQELLNEHSIFYFVNSGDATIGYFKVNVESAQSEGIEGGFEIERIYLLNAYQGLGFGQLMFNKIFEIAREMGKKHLWLGVWEKNYGAIRFYERNGFKVFARHDFFLGKDQQIDLLMESILE